MGAPDALGGMGRVTEGWGNTGLVNRRAAVPIAQ
jgi:hypothetical protein